MNNLIIIKKYALNYLSKYDSSKMNLKRVIKNKIKRLSLEKKDKFHLYNSIENILSEFESKNLINDKEYAIRKIQIFSQQGKSKIYIQNYLLVKGIEKEFSAIKTKNYVRPNDTRNSVEFFKENGCSDLMVEVFGENGKHARFAVGTNSLPRHFPVEVDAIFELS